MNQELEAVLMTLRKFDRWLVAHLLVLKVVPDRVIDPTAGMTRDRAKEGART